MRILAFVIVAACIPTGGPPGGALHGTIAGAPVAEDIDASSQFVLQRSSSCSTPDQSIFDLFYGSHRFELGFRLDGGPSVFADITYKVPAPVGSALFSFSTTPGSGMASLTVGITG